jgi:PIN domain nuclease of toxin-antitoxin system
MKLLLDTHVFLWSTMKQLLSGRASAAFLAPDNQLYFSTASYWEICIKLAIGKVELDENRKEIIENELVANNIRWLDIAREHCQRIVELPRIHGDPFDRLLIAQALCEEMTLLTADANIMRYEVPTLW